MFVFWLATGFALSEDLPLIDAEFMPRDKDTAAGAVDDARPDRWGERVIRFLDRPPRLSVLTFSTTLATSALVRWGFSQREAAAKTLRPG